jgi:hypothetical protein
MTKKTYTTSEVAKIEGVSERRIRAKIKQGHYPHVTKCPCGQAHLIPAEDLRIKK